MMFWICACCISTSAQIEIDHSQLIGTKWQRIEPVVRNVNSYMQFTETCIVDSIYYSTLEKSASGSKEGRRGRHEAGGAEVWRRPGGEARDDARSADVEGRPVEALGH